MYTLETAREPPHLQAFTCNHAHLSLKKIEPVILFVLISPMLRLFSTENSPYWEILV